MTGVPYEVLWAQHSPAASRLARTLVPAHAAPDVVSEAFTKVLDAARRGGGPEAAFRPYLLAAVRNTARTWHARGRRLVPVPDPEPPPAAGPEDELALREDARLAGQAFRSLPERWRLVLWATAVEEAAPAALADRWGMSANAVAQLASRAREGLRQAYLTAHLGTALPPACRAVAPHMGAAVRGKASRRRRQDLTAHLAGCPRCSQAFEGLGALNARLGELLIPAAAAGSVLGRVLPAAHAAGRGLRLLAWPAAGAVAVTALAGTVPLTVTGPAPAAQAAAPSPGARQVPSYAPRHARTAARRHIPPASPPGRAQAGPEAPAPVMTPPGRSGGLSGTLGTAGGAVRGTGRAAGGAVSGIGQAAGSAVNSLAPGQSGSAAGQAVSGIGCTAGQAVQQVTGAAGQLLGGL